MKNVVTTVGMYMLSTIVLLLSVMSLEIYATPNDDLLKAAKDSNFEAAQKALENGADVNATITEGDAKGVTALMIAALEGQMETARLLLEHEANVNAKSAEGLTPLMFALLMSNRQPQEKIDLITLLLEHEAEVNARLTSGEAEGVTPLMMAASLNSMISLPLIELFLKHGADVNATITADSAFNGWTPLTFALQEDRYGKLKVLELLLEHGADVNVKFAGSGFEVIQYICGDLPGFFGRLQGAQSVKCPSKITPLMLEAGRKDIESLKLLIQSGADVNATIIEGEYEGGTALMRAVAEENLENIKLLIEHGADVNAKITAEGDYKGWTALSLALDENNTDIGNLLRKHMLEHGANVDATFFYDEAESEITLLMLATQEGDLDMVTKLLERGADVNTGVPEGSMRGVTALMIAAATGNKAILQLLLEQGADVNAQVTTDDEHAGWTALMLAEMNEHTELATLLKNAGATVNEEQSLSLEKEKVASTKAMMRAIGTGLGSYQIDTNTFPACPEEKNFREIKLPKEYYSGEYEDVWGTPFKYLSDGSSFTLESYGADKTEGTGSSEFDADIIYSNGKFIVP